MIKTTVADVVRSTIATDNPLTALNEVMVESLQLLSALATCGSVTLDKRLQHRGRSLRAFSVILVINPLLCSLLEVIGRMLVLHLLLEQESDALLHLLVGKRHTKTELAEVLKQ